MIATALQIAAIAIALALLLNGWRLYRGPALADRILVLDHGILSVDVTLADGAGRRPGEAGFAELRGSLLDALGVEQERKVAATA